MAKRLEDRIKGVFTWFKDQITSYPYLLMTTVGVLLVGYLLITRFGQGSSDWADWTGFGPHISPENSYYRPVKTLWDWLELLIIPIVLAIGAWALNKTERETEREIALDRQRQATLQAYYDRMTELLLKEELLKSSEDDPVRTVVRTITLATLRGLDGIRKGLVVRFLYEANLLEGVLDLAGADLSGAILSGTDLIGTGMSRVNLSGVDLSGADLSGAILNKVNLNEADMNRANLSGAGLGMTDLSEANLSGADLNRAYLIEVNLSEADLSEADLSRTRYDVFTHWPKGFDPQQRGAILEDETVEEEENTV